MNSDKTHEYSPFDFVIKIQQSKITVNKSKDHSNKMDTKLLFLIEFSCVLSKSKVNSSKYEWSLDLLSLTVESL